MRVQHIMYGEGTVVSTDAAANTTTVNFDSHGVKTVPSSEVKPMNFVFG